MCIRDRGDPGPLGQGGHPGPGARRVYGDRPGGAGARLLGLAGRPGGEGHLALPHLGRAGVGGELSAAGGMGGNNLEGQGCVIKKTIKTPPTGKPVGGELRWVSF